MGRNDCLLFHKIATHIITKDIILLLSLTSIQADTSNSKLDPVLIKHWHSLNMIENYVEAKAVLDNVKSTAWRFFKFRVTGADVDKSFVHCKLCLDGGDTTRGQIKNCGGTANMTNHLKAFHKTDYKSLEQEVPKQSFLTQSLCCPKQISAKVAKVK